MRMIALATFFAGVVVTHQDRTTRGEDAIEATPDVKALIEATFSDKVEERFAAVRQLGDMGEAAAAAIPSLIRLLDDRAYEKGTFYKVAMAASSALAKIGEPSVEPCFAVVRGSPGGKQYGAISSLSDNKHGSAIPKLVQLLEGPDPGIHRRVLICLNEKITDARLFDSVVRIFRGKDLELRIRAAWNLGDANDPRAVELLVAALRDKEPRVRETAAIQLGRQKDTRAVSPLLNVLADKLKDKGIRTEAARALGEIGDPRASKALLDALEDTEPDSPRHIAALALGHLRDRGAVAPLLKVLTDKLEDECLRINAVIALGEIGDPRASKALLEVLNSTEPYWLRRRAASALGRLRDRGAVQSLSRIFRDRGANSSLRIYCVNALSEIDPQAAVPPLLEVIENKDDDKWVRYIAATRLADIKNGAVDDMAVVDLIWPAPGGSGGLWHNQVIAAGQHAREMLGAIEKNGKTEAIRATAAQKLKKAGPSAEKAFWRRAMGTERPQG